MPPMAEMEGRGVGALEPILRVERISKHFGSLRALDEVSLSVPRGSITLLIGPNGSGKSTLVNVISGTLRADGGKIYFEGADITDLPPHERFRLGIVRSYQVPRLFQGLSVLENSLIGRDGNPGEGIFSSLLKSIWMGFEQKATEDAVEKLDLVRLIHMAERRPTELSGGQMKLLEMARSTMAPRPKLVLLDEPTAGVNPTLAHQILDFVRALSKDHGITFLIVEHRLDIALKYVDYAYAMHLGKVIAEGKPEEVLNDKRVIQSYLGE